MVINKINNLSMLVSLSLTIVRVLIHTHTIPREEVITSLTIFSVLFTGLALLHAAEIAITTLYPWKVREFAEEEEKQSAGTSNNKRGTFKILNEDITRVLTTILVTSTASSIYGRSIRFVFLRWKMNYNFIW